MGLGFGHFVARLQGAFDKTTAHIWWPRNSAGYLSPGRCNFKTEKSFMATNIAAADHCVCSTSTLFARRERSPYFQLEFLTCHSCVCRLENPCLPRVNAFFALSCIVLPISIHWQMAARHRYFLRSITSHECLDLTSKDHIVLELGSAHLNWLMTQTARKTLSQLHYLSATEKILRQEGHSVPPWCSFGKFHGFGAAWCKNDELYQIGSIGATVAPLILVKN